MNTTQESTQTKWLLRISVANIADVWAKLETEGALPRGVRIHGKSRKQGYATVIGPRDGCELLRDQIHNSHWGNLTEVKQGEDHSFGSF